MCGIAGITVGTRKRIGEEDRMRMERAVSVMQRRGPDGNGISAGDSWLLGHARLAIMDPAAGQQPLRDEASGVTLSYNGEIFNYKELREKLRAAGHSFCTNCDTEVVLKAYLEWGRSCVERFNGFFAFCIADPRSQSFFAARDRAGVKPLFHRNNGDSFCLASSLPALFACQGGEKRPNLAAISHYLSTGRPVFGDETLFSGVKNLRPAHCLIFNWHSGLLDIWRYWSRPVLAPSEKNPPPFEEAVAETRSLIQDAVKIRLMSDVPLGAFLSGGLDSAIVVGNAARQTPSAIPVFCAGTEDEKSNEFNYAEMVARQNKAKLEKIVISPADLEKDWDFLIAEKGFPLSTPNEISIYRLASALRHKCTVTLTGEGADEIFGGYVQPHFSAFDFDRCPHRSEDAENDSPFALAMTMLYGRSWFINDTDHYTSTSTWLPYASKKSLFSSEVWPLLDDDSSFFAFYEDFFGGLGKCSTFDKRLHLHAEFNLENLLMRIDNSTMAASVEARVPFTDYRLIESAFKMPDSYKMAWRSPEAEAQGAMLTAAEIDRLDLLETKRLPRHAFEDMVPSEIIRRKKMSFPVPFNDWFSGPLKKNVESICLESEFSKTYFQQSVIEAMLARGDRNLWLIANLCRWHQSSTK
ncbi:MAG: asparagine synthase (glutamine-hydrolyzing) [Lentisphaerae bacterium GWF2_52_8]|nr:MAG: asparagine synthase (glutamine-hydrolyzing) [Lentisphaerae bacterium GWF2_52_8]